jgi:DNA processing protein
MNLSSLKASELLYYTNERNICQLFPFLVPAAYILSKMDVRELAREDWPKPLLEIPQPPKQLWLRGEMPPSGHKLLTVVGSRAITRYGQEACEKLIAGLAGYPISIVSGLALGVDTCAHKAALAAGLHTLAFPGSGVGDAVLYPRSNRLFARELVERGGGIISEYAPTDPSRVYYFPERNRLMVGVSDAVLLIEAGQKSGTLITARLASEYNRELLCVPHRIGDPHSFGSHLFLRLGATLVTEPLHILEALGIPPRESITSLEAPGDLEEIELVIWNMLEEPRNRDEILRGASGPAGELLTALVSLELRGLIREEFGAWRRV